MRPASRASSDVNWCARPRSWAILPPLLGSPYLTNLRTWGPSPIVDQSVGGMLMWVGGDVVFLVAMGLVVAAWVRAEDRRTAREDAREDARLTRVPPTD